MNILPLVTYQSGHFAASAQSRGYLELEGLPRMFGSSLVRQSIPCSDSHRKWWAELSDRLSWYKVKWSIVPKTFLPDKEQETAVLEIFLGGGGFAESQ